MDDGSNDGTRQVVEKIADKRIKYLHQTNQGPVAARNHALQKVNTKWVTYLDSDDELMPNCLERLLHYMEKDPKAVFGFPRAKRTLELYEDGKLTKIVDESDDTPPKLGLKDVFNRKVHLNPNGIIHLKEAFEEGVSWDAQAHPMEDWDFIMTLAEKYPEGFVYIPEVLVHYHMRFGGDGIVSNSSYAVWADTFERIYQKHRSSAFLEGQTWYPEKVEKWNRLQKDYDLGKSVPYNKYYFR